MPENESFWNPYRWVELPARPDDYEEPRYHHKFAGIAGNIVCELTTLTPLFINNGSGEPCERRDVAGRYVIPGTSLKGAIRSLAEIVGNGCGPFAADACEIDPEHAVDNATRGSFGRNWQLDVVARTFGLLRRTGSEAQVFRGHIRISDAIPFPKGQTIRPMAAVQLVGASPKPQHEAFYPDNKRRKLYHHQRVESLPDWRNRVSQRMLSSARPLPPGCTFRFEVNFWNLTERELALLLYCLFLEEEVTVVLSKDAVNGKEPATLTGPMRHKIGGAKPFGAGSVAIQPVRMRLCVDLAARYRGTAERWQEFEGEALKKEIQDRTKAIRSRNDKTMQQLRAMLIYADNDPRKPVHWPSAGWFREHARVPLKPTL